MGRQNQPETIEREKKMKKIDKKIEKLRKKTTVSDRRREFC